MGNVVSRFLLQLQRDFIAGNSSASLTDMMGARAHGYYKILQVD
jgi:hypothetical protein